MHQAPVLATLGEVRLEFVEVYPAALRACLGGGEEVRWDDNLVVVVVPPPNRTQLKEVRWRIWQKVCTLHCSYGYCLHVHSCDQSSPAARLAWRSPSEQALGTSFSE